MSYIFDSYASFKKIIRYKLKFRFKPWVTPALLKTISVKNKIFKSFIKEKDITQKNVLHNYYKSYKNLISCLIKIITLNTLKAT